MKKIDYFMTTKSESGDELKLGVDKNNNLYVNENKVKTESKIELSGWVSVSIIISALCALFALLIEIYKTFYLR